jgi:hypothetical protein
MAKSQGESFGHLPQTPAILFHFWLNAESRKADSSGFHFCHASALQMDKSHCQSGNRNRGDARIHEAFARLVARRPRILSEKIDFARSGQKSK